MLRAPLIRTALVLTLILGACSGVPDVERDPSGQATAAGTVRADRIRVGDCFDDPASRAVKGFPVKPCAESHDNEVFFEFDVSGGTYPGKATLTEIATARCTGDAFTAYVGRAYEGSTLDVFEVLPTPDTWDHDGDRQVVCALYAKDRSPLTGSMKGAGAGR